MRLDYTSKLTAFVILALIVIGAVIIANVLSFREIERLTINQLLDNKFTETKFAASQIETHINKVQSELVTLSKFPIAQSTDQNDCKVQLIGSAKISEEGLDSFLLTDKEGSIVGCSSVDYVDYLGLNIKDKDYFKMPWQTNEPYITSVLKQGTNREIIVSVPLFETAAYTPYPNFVGKFRGVLFSIIDVNKLYYLYLLPLVNNQEGSFFIINAEDGQIILQSEKVDKYGDLKELIPKQGEKTQFIRSFENEKETIITSSDVIVGKEHWKLVILTPLKNIGKETRAVQQGHILSLSLVMLVILVVFGLSLMLYRSKEKMKNKLDKASITLEKLGIKAELENTTYTPSDIILEPKKIYLFKDVEENHGFDYFISSLNRGFLGLGAVREDPRKICRKYNLQKTPFIWITDQRIENVPSEKNVEAITHVMMEFIKKNSKSVIFLEGLDYLLLENGTEVVMKRMHALKDLISLQDSLMIISINPETLDENMLRNLGGIAVDVYGKELKDKVELTDIEKKILILINDKNSQNSLVSFKDITHTFNITKPTTRVKISKLLSLNLIQVETNGRFKSLRITSRGRKII